MAHALMLLAPRELSFQEIPIGSPGPGEIRLRSLLSAISHGTELNLYRGTSPYDDHVFDRELRAFMPAGATSPYPAIIGYGLVSIIEEVGPGVDGFSAGDLVHSATPHRDEAVLDVEQARSTGFPLVRLPAGASLEAALYISVATVALQGIQDAQIKLGDHVAVVGLGAIGLLTAQMAKLSGAASVHVIDPVESRRQLALELGADAAYDPATTEPNTGVVIKQALGGRGVDVAIETSGNDAGLQDAIASVHLGGTVVAVGFYQGGAPRLRLGEEWTHNRLTMLSSMGGWAAPHRNAPAWDRRRMVEFITGLLCSGTLQTERLGLRTFPFAEAEKAYEWLDEHPSDAIKVALTYDTTR